MQWQLEILVHTHIEIAEKPLDVSHSLQINDPNIMQLFQILCEEMQPSPAKHPRTAQAICLALMSRLHQYLLTHPARIANTSFPPTSQIATVSSDNSARIIWQDAINFIQLHLHESLTLPRIAHHADISPAHLNRLFHQFSGVPVMRYVKLQRIAAAQKILGEGTENITEIAEMVGFKSITVFCRVFRSESGVTPNQFRRQKKLH